MGGSEVDKSALLSESRRSVMSVGPITITDEEMGGLQTAGLAREFDIAGASSVTTYDGVPR